MGAVLLQAYVLEEARKSEVSRKSEVQEKNGGKCEFYNSLELMRLRLIPFISGSTVLLLENSRHGFVVEAYTVRWSIGKFIKYLWGSEFTVLSDYSGLQKFFES